MTVDLGLIRALVLAETAGAALLVTIAFAVTIAGGRLAARRVAQRDAWLARTLTPAADEDLRVVASGEAGPEEPADLLGDDHWAVATRSTVTSQIAGTSADRTLPTSALPHARDAAQRWCRSRRWWRRLQGVRALSLLGADEPDLTHMLWDPRPEVRTEVAAWAAAHPNDRAVSHLLAMLDDPEGSCRWAASDAILRLGGAAVEPLRAHLETNPPRLADALRLAARLATPALLEPALRACTSEDAAVRAAAVDVAAAIGGPETFTALEALLRDPDAGVRAAAARGIGRLEGRTFARALAELLYDPVWTVRRAAATSLRALGPTGRLHLRRALTDPDPRASEIAKHVVDLPEAALGVNP